ncbi:hypothetical protein W97_04695 [Coniosporium apollinis CBS 100218]|uniref:DASH complex subunit SPC34 n=1 Tax=Coniosporium apollinis (strain CBS 100218) TaxID=1168221 RepID=R7YU68_CONA1|nr:uncharacterized protein W97_04695 [Coniosporium apollinis CBS 100218]EON65457.1 hypothetical protein W97_04695 [Coniosporium apollinis CBS 100218]
MTLLDAHLEQISLCAASIAELPFPPPKIFTNALLQPHDITALIRDTEIHERALFSVPAPPPPPKAQDSSSNASRRHTAFNASGNSSVFGGGGVNTARAPRRNTAVAAVLGGELVERIWRGGGGGVGSGLGYRSFDGRDKGEVDVDVLLEGAEKLCGVYPIPGAAEKIHSLRQRHRRLAASLEHYEMRIAEQSAQLNRMNRSHAFDAEDDLDDAEATNAQPSAPAEIALRREDLHKEEEEIRELECRKRELEDRVSSMGRDLSGVLR